MPDRKAAFGFRAHSGWAALVVLAGPLDSPSIVERSHIEIADPAMAGARQPFHAAAGLSLRDAEALVNTLTECSVHLASQALQAAMTDAQQKGYQVFASGILAGSGKALPDLAKILASHPLLHTAEGELFRNVLARACRDLHLSVITVKEDDLLPRLQDAIGVSGDRIQHHLQRMGKAIGAPWTRDEKCAALCAWIALAA